MMKEREVILTAKDLKKYYTVDRGMLSHKVKGTVKAVDGLNFQIFRNETLGVIGESGCGKSTLARVLLGLTDATEGSVTCLGTPISTRMPREMRKHVQMVFQDPYSSIDPRMNVGRIVEEPLRIHMPMTPKRQRMELVLNMMERLGFNEDDLRKYPHEFSGGQRQRIGIARAFILNPEFIICDEPVSALDVSIQAQILNLFKKLQAEQGVTYMFISHDMSVVKHMSDRIAVMYLGHIMELAGKDELFANTLHPYTQALMAAIPVPNPERSRRRKLLGGDLPSPLNPPEGCLFSTRCEHATELCRRQKPVLRETSPEHFVACHYAGQEGGKQP